MSEEIAASDVPDVGVPAARRRNGLAVVLVATAIAGGLGYLIQALAGFGLSPAAYAGFGVFWATLYLVVGGVSGIQQEVSRATHPPEASGVEDRRASIPALAGVFAGAVVVVIAASAPFWAGLVFGDEAVVDVVAVAIGAAAYVVFASACGILYGRRAWLPLAVTIVADPLLRLIFLATSLAFDLGTAWVDAAVVAPIPLTALLAVVLIARFVKGRTRVDVQLRRLVANSAKTIVGATATAVLVSGLPLFIGATAGGASAAVVGALIFNITLTRAPLVIPFLALQSYLVVHFREARGRATASLLRILAGVIALTAVAAVVAGLLAPAIIGTIFGDGYEFPGWTVAALVASAGLTGALCVTGPATIARSGHTAFLVGWVVAAVTLIVVLFLPLDLVTRTIVALAVAPSLGLAVHLGYLIATSVKRKRAGASS